MHIPISVVVCSRTRPDMVADCVRSLRGSRHPHYEIVIVDNTDDGQLDAALATDEIVRVVREPRPGLSRARNTGLGHCRHDAIAFVDDDVIVEPDWLAAIADTFRDPSIDAVTGLILPLELETEAQREFEWYGGMGKGAERRLFTGATLSAKASIMTQAVGVGANMAFRRDLLARLGGFDEALGAGTLTLGAEDLDFFHRALRAGATFCYQPSAVVRHRHRRSIDELRAQIFANGCSYGVYLLKIWARRSVARSRLASFAVSWVTGRVGTALFRTVTKPGLRCQLAWDEVRGITHAWGTYRRAYQLVPGAER